jgi:hypothetical protein
MKTTMELADNYATITCSIDETTKARTALAERIEALEKDAALGNIAMKFVDRAGDVADCDPAERICAEFYKAMADEVEKHWADRKAMKGETP